MKDYNITIRSIQHFLYCPHRWGLIEINCNFAENFYVYRGNLVHQNVDNNKGVKSRGIFHENSVHVFNDELCVYGVIDCLELKKDNNGVYIDKYKEKFKLTIVEYKPTAPKKDTVRHEDRMQLLAQKICADNIFKTDVETYFCYANTKKRVKIEYTREDYTFLETTIEKINRYLEKKEIPEISEKQNCSGCSMVNICLPKQAGRNGK